MNSTETAGPTDLSVHKPSGTVTTSTVGTGTGTSSTPPLGGYLGAGMRSLSSSSSTSTTTAVNHRRVGSNNGSGSSTATGMLQLFPTMTAGSTGITGGGTTPALPLQPSGVLNQATPPAATGSKLLNKADVVTVRQLIAGYRESAAFLLRSADELEHLLLLRG